MVVLPVTPNDMDVVLDVGGGGIGGMITFTNPNFVVHRLSSGVNQSKIAGISQYRPPVATKGHSFQPDIPFA